MIKKCCYLFFLLLLPLCANARTIEGFFDFRGDSQGMFVGNTVVVLDDGSSWKIHPDSTDDVNGWYAGDHIGISKRDAFFFFKREHKFLLLNYTTGTVAKAMIVGYGPNPLYIVEASEPYPTRMEREPVKDKNGNITHYRETPAGFQKKLYLNDGSMWIINDYNRFTNYKQGDFVYFGIKEKDDKLLRFLISGIEREAVWTKVY